jgi:signal transduction histidine kinase
VAFEDDGAGVGDGEKEKIFGYGYGKNTGFGLAFSRDILSVTEIVIRETGAAGRGARFEILVPPRAWRMVVGGEPGPDTTDSRGQGTVEEG